MSFKITDENLRMEVLYMLRLSLSQLLSVSEPLIEKIKEF